MPRCKEVSDLFEQLYQMRRTQGSERRERALRRKIIEHPKATLGVLVDLVTAPRYLKIPEHESPVGMTWIGGGSHQLMLEYICTKATKLKIGQLMRIYASRECIWFLKEAAVKKTGTLSLKKQIAFLKLVLESKEDRLIDENNEPLSLQIFSQLKIPKRNREATTLWNLVRFERLDVEELKVILICLEQFI